MHRSFFLLLALFATSGCAHVFEILDNQSIETSNLSKFRKKPDKNDTRIITLDGPRRLVRSTFDGQNWQMCAETQADAIAGRTSSSAIEVVDKAKFGDSIGELLVVTNNRTELNDAIRQLSWQICNNHANGYIDRHKAEQMFGELLTGSITTLQMRAAIDLAAFRKAKDEAEASAKKLKCVAEANGVKAEIDKCLK